MRIFTIIVIADRAENVVDGAIVRLGDLGIECHNGGVRCYQTALNFVPSIFLRRFDGRITLERPYLLLCYFFFVAVHYSIIN